MAKGSKEMLIQVGGILLYLIATIAVVSSSRAWLYINTLYMALYICLCCIYIAIFSTQSWFMTCYACIHA